MDIWQSLVLGIVQGITEFLPISSTAHLVLVPGVFGWEDPGLQFDVALHLGTFFAVLWYFWRDIARLLVAWLGSFRKPDLKGDPQQRLAWFILVACIPGGLAGVLLEDKAETVFRSSMVIGIAMVVFAILLLVSELVSKRALDEDEINWGQALVIGIAQGIAIIPGASRSGVTMTAGLLVGLTREAAARFSFLLGTPIIFAAMAYKLKDLIHAPSALYVPMAVGILASTVTGYLSIKFLIAYLKEKSTGIFIGYRIVVGFTIIGLSMAGILH